MLPGAAAAAAAAAASFYCQDDDDPRPHKLPDSCDDVDPWKLEDVTDISTGEPLFSKFTWEDWMMLELRFQLHALVHGYKHCMNDPERAPPLVSLASPCAEW